MCSMKGLALVLTLVVTSRKEPTAAVRRSTIPPSDRGKRHRTPSPTAAPPGEEGFGDGDQSSAEQQQQRERAKLVVVLGLPLSGAGCKWALTWPTTRAEDRSYVGTLIPRLIT